MMLIRATVTALLALTLAGAPKPLVNTNSDSPALRGYDADALYLNCSKRVQRMWEQGIPGYIARGRQNSPGVLDK